MSSEQLMARFSDPVGDAQHVFRRLLNAMAEPGLVQPLGQLPAVSTKHLAAYGVALCLLDHATAVWLSPAFNKSSFRQSLAFHCGCTFVSVPEQAQFVFIHVDELESVFDRLHLGTDRDPEFSATAIVQIDAWDVGTEYEWSGPGIRDIRKVRLPFNASFWQLRKQKNQFPRGVDVFVVSGQAVLGLPRTTSVK